MTKTTKKQKLPYYARQIDVPGPGASVEGQIRYSDRNQAGSLTIESQRRIILEFCEQRAWKVISWSLEEDISGGPETIDERPIWRDHIAKIGLSVDCSVSIDLSRWSRDPVAPWLALRQIRDQGGYWCTADGQHSLDKIETDLGAQVGFAIGNITNNNYLRQLSRRTIMGDVTRARKGLHNGPVCFGYTRPPIPPPPPGYNLMIYKSQQRLPIIPDETFNSQAGMTNFQALQKIGQFRADEYSYEQIATWLNKNGFRTGTTNIGNLSITKRKIDQENSSIAPGSHGNRPFIPEGVRALCQSRLPREFVREDGTFSGHGTVYDPIAKVELEGQHQAAWNADLCERIDMVNEAHRTVADVGRKTYSERQRLGYYDNGTYIYSGLLLCALCGSHINGTRPGVYMDMAFQWSRECPTGRTGTIRDIMLDTDMQLMFNFTLSIGLMNQVRHRAQELAQVYQHTHQEASQVVLRRTALDGERKRIVSLFIKGDIDEEEKDEMLAPIKAELQLLRPRTLKLPELNSEQIIAAGEQWMNLATLWRFMSAPQKGEMLGILIEPRGIMVDMEYKQIVRIRPKPAFESLCMLALTPSIQHDKWFDLPAPDGQQRETLLKEIAAERGISLRIRKDGKLARGSRFLPPELLEKMYELFAQGHSCVAIARICDVDRKTVYRYVLRNQPGKPPTDRRRLGRVKVDDITN
jgi:hypothetical protein